MKLPNFRVAVARKLMSGFDAASRSITRIKNWLPTNTEVNTLIIADGNLMRARARKLVRENPYAKGAVDCYVANCIGTGIVPRSLHPDPEIRKQIDASWDLWSKESDADGLQDFYGLQSTACRAIKTDGEVFARLRFRRATDNMHVPLQIQLLEADFCPYWKMDYQANYYTRAGIQFNLLGQRELYWLYRDHPGSSWVKDGTLYPVPAEQVLHCFHVERPGQLRGQPWMTAAIIMLYDVKQLMDAALLRQKVVNLLSVWIKRAAGGSGILNETDQKDGTGITGLVPGSVNYLDGGEEPVFLNPPEAGIAFKEFLNSMLRAVARALGLTYEQLSGDLNGVTFSSIRAGLQEMRRFCEQFQYHVMVHQFCDQIWPVWVEQAILAGVWGDTAAADFKKNPQDWLSHRWDPPGWPYVNPVDDVNAAKEAARCGFTSRSRVVAATGENPEEVDREQAADAKRADDLKLQYDSDGRNAAAGPRVTEVSNPTDAAAAQGDNGEPADPANGNSKGKVK